MGYLRVGRQGWHTASSFECPDSPGHGICHKQHLGQIITTSHACFALTCVTHLLPVLVPDCRRDPPRVGSRHELQQWMCQLHNTVCVPQRGVFSKRACLRCIRPYSAHTIVNHLDHIIRYCCPQFTSCCIKVPLFTSHFLTFSSCLNCHSQLRSGLPAS